jgi:hypothetical protein
MDKFIKHMQRRVAETCIGASSLRNQGSAGVLKSAREYFAELRLNKFSELSEHQFSIVLNRETNRLRERLPANAQNWGTARKAINLFLRDALYNRYLSKHYSMVPMERFLEVPLDKYVATALLDLDGADLPKWKGIKFLSEGNSHLYQAEAHRYAKEKGTYRVHLDLLWFRPIET